MLNTKPIGKMSREELIDLLESSTPGQHIQVQIDARLKAAIIAETERRDITLKKAVTWGLKMFLKAHAPEAYSELYLDD